MRKGLHAYLNVNNLNEIINKEDKNTTREDLTRIVHILSTYYNSIAKILNKNGLGYIEKISGERVHFVFEEHGEPLNADKILETLISFHILNYNFINKLRKYSGLDNFQVSTGADYGVYYNYEHVKNGKVEELTSIGYPANRAAKLTEKAGNNEIILPLELVKRLSYDLKDAVRQIDRSEMKRFYSKYENGDYVRINVNQLVNQFAFDDIDVRTYVETQYSKINFEDVVFRHPKKLISFDQLSEKNNRKVDGIPFHADLRGFTKMFKEDGSNLKEMVRTTKEVLDIMESSVVENSGIKVQFQGDKIVALFHKNAEHGSEEYIENAIDAGFVLIGKIIQFNKLALNNLPNIKMSVGIGQSIGELYATRIGLKRNKHNILLGRINNLANKAEDEYALEDSIVITSDLYGRLKKSLQDIFRMHPDNRRFYITEEDYRNYSRKRIKEVRTKESKQYNKEGKLGQYNAL